MRKDKNGKGSERVKQQNECAGRQRRKRRRKKKRDKEGKGKKRERFDGGGDGKDEDCGRGREKVVMIVVVVRHEISKKKPKKPLVGGARWSVRSMSAR